MKALVLENMVDGLLVRKMELDENTVTEQIHEAVGGYIERVPYFKLLNQHMIDAWINEDGKILGLPSTLTITNEDGEIVDIIVGNIVFTKNDGYGETIGLEKGDCELIRKFLTGK